MTLREMWKEYLELEHKCNELYYEGYRSSNINQQYKLNNKVYNLSFKKHRILCSFVNKYYEEVVTIKYGKDKIILTNGVILYYDGRVYEPLEVVMRKIIKKHEEVVQVGGNDE